MKREQQDMKRKGNIICHNELFSCKRKSADKGFISCFNFSSESFVTDPPPSFFVDLKGLICWTTCSRFHLRGNVIIWSLFLCLPHSPCFNGVSCCWIDNCITQTLVMLKHLLPLLMHFVSTQVDKSDWLNGVNSDWKPPTDSSSSVELPYVCPV